MPDSRSEALRLLRAFTQAHGAPSGEDEPRSLFASELKALAGVRLATDKLGGIFAEQPASSGPRVLIACHLDEVGFMVQNITESGFLQFVPLGGWWGHTLLAQRVRVKTRSGREVLGVITSTPPHFLSESQRNNVIKEDQMFLDVGGKNRADVRERLGIELGDTIVPESDFREFNHPDLLLSKAFDNRVGCAAVVQAAQGLYPESLPCRLIAAGTVQEEIGTRGAKTLAHAVKADVALVLEGPPADDTPGFNRADSQGKLGGGVQIRLFDPSAVMSRRLADFVIATAQAANIPHQVTVRRSGGTDAAAFHVAGEGVPSIVLGVPARYIHTHNSVIDLNDQLAAVSLVQELVRRLDAATVASLTHFA